MKTLMLGLAAALFSFAASANYQTAEELYKLRGENVQNAFKAYELYLDMAKTEPSEDLKAQNYWLAGQAVFFVGEAAKDNSEKKKYHTMGFEAAAKGVALLEPKWDSLSESQKEILANSYYWYGGNLGKWGEANGIASSLGRWPELQNNMKNIIALKMQHIQDFGAFRILARAFYKLPFPLGSNKKAYNYIEKACEETKHPKYGISRNSLNVLYYAQIMIATGYADDAEKMLKTLVDITDLNDYNPDRVPETKVEQAEAVALLNSLR